MYSLFVFAYSFEDSIRENAVENWKVGKSNLRDSFWKYTELGSGIGGTYCIAYLRNFVDVVAHKAAA